MIASATATAAAAAGPAAPGGPPAPATAGDAFAAMLDDIAAADQASAADPALSSALLGARDATAATGPRRMAREARDAADNRTAPSAADAALADDQAANAGLLMLMATLAAVPTAPGQPPIAPQAGTTQDTPLVDDAAASAPPIGSPLDRAFERQSAMLLDDAKGQRVYKTSLGQTTDVQAADAPAPTDQDAPVTNLYPSRSDAKAAGSLVDGEAHQAASSSDNTAPAARTLTHAAASAASQASALQASALQASAQRELPVGNADRSAPQVPPPDRPAGKPGSETHAVDLPKPSPLAGAVDVAPVESASGRPAGQDSRGSSSSFSSLPWTRAGADAAVQFQARADAAAPSFARAMDGHLNALTPSLTPHTWPAVGAVAAATGSAVVPDEVATQIVQAVNMQWNDGVGEARITLRPEYLGGVSISLHVDQGGVSAVLHAESPAVRTWLQANEPMLRQGLSEQGLRLERLVIAEQGQTDAGDAPREETERRREQPRRQRARPDATEPFELIL